jgi:hypothetical protein
MLLWLTTPVVTCLTLGVSACLNKSSVRFCIVTCEAEPDVRMMMAAGRIGNFDGGSGSGNSHTPHINSSMPAMLYCKDL